MSREAIHRQFFPESVSPQQLSCTALLADTASLLVAAQRDEAELGARAGAIVQALPNLTQVAGVGSAVRRRDKTR
eukprot:CAMPEP_0175867614 /NCGR_PEP_ID=MMETSP0107_2-20121207/34920_1 /TAXON_ID=195067 ORGANISM="Goniomonas pacifica, Strain CCMP1869" /NCGR_SAMPLE_ID=MMETSP0107_2 /ASSEMBLY_ACC=CAM_ASM_000203 /LENGTH=74 /DNA_ID=CAMNT_0017185387 /DNA_START=5 /DNA_END=229 /DNA_ORIENTATION=+